MIYQKLYMGEPTDLIAAREKAGFPKHKHPEIELYYCVEGSSTLIVDRKKYKLSGGNLCIVGSMVPHEVLEASGEAVSRSIAIEVGPAMLGEHFRMLRSNHFSSSVLPLGESKYEALHTLFEETAKLIGDSSPLSALHVKGNIYKISAYIAEEMLAAEDAVHIPRKVNSIERIENLIEYIYNGYDRKLTVEAAANLCGYSKSNFCKMFKKVTGETFHTVLNKYRVNIASIMLRETDFSIEEIAEKSGFLDSKSFGRTFKTITGETPSSYRKKNKE